MIQHPGNRSIHSLFEAQVQRSPEAVAAISAATALTYQELNERANQLARYLQTLGVGAETLVGICVERSLDMLVGLLAILKAGGAYVPLDPAYPQERLAWMMADSQLSFLLAQTHTLSVIPEHSAKVICLDTEWQTIAQFSSENLLPVSPYDLAYIIYTSGSTGKPKGVMIEHQSLVNYVQAAIVTYELKASDRVLQFASISFDASAEEIYPCLCVGATLILRTDLMLASVATFLQTCQDWQLTTLSLPTAYWHQLTIALETEALTLPTTLRLVIIGGEKALPVRVAAWQQQVGQSVRLLNTYGPTESTVVATVYDLAQFEPLLTSGEVPIGKPLPNIEVYLLDHDRQPVASGTVGELYLGGAGLARGYLNRADLTSEKFIAYSLPEQPSIRLYRTGDLVRSLPDGNLEYLGRIDQQVKIRGFRIELGEIETSLAQHPEVREAVVIDRESNTGEKYLVGYVVLHQQGVLTTLELRQHLKQKLPAYMIPTIFVLLEALPLTANGKIDRNTLPSPDLTQFSSSVEFIAPRNPTEQELAAIWTDVLQLDTVSIMDHFFELGGHSLLGTQVISRIRDRFQVELPLRSLFNAPTIVELAQLVDEQRTQAIQLPIAKIQPITRNQRLPLSFAQQRLWFLDQLVPNSSFYNIPQALRLQGELNLAALEQSLNAIVQRHEALRTTFVVVDAQPVQVIAPELNVELSVVDLRSLATVDREAKGLQLVTEAAQQPFDLTQDSLFRCQLWCIDAEEYILLITMHHIIADGWSIGVLIRELAALYEAFVMGQPSPLTALAIQYADFASWQRQWFQGEVLEQQLAYWQQQLAGAPTVLELPSDRPRPLVQAFRGGVASFLLPQSLCQAVEQLSQAMEVTPFMTLFTAFQILLYRYTGQSDILVGSPIANRHYAGIEPLIGFFINTLVLRTDLTGNPTGIELLQRVRENALAAYAHQDLPFELLVEAMQAVRNLSHTPLFQVMFVLQNAPTPALELADLTMQPLQLENGARLDWTIATEDSEAGLAQFDLTLSLEYTEQGMIGIWEYNAELFDADRIARMAEHYQILLAGIVAKPEQRISELAMLTTAEQQLLTQWNRTTNVFVSQLCIHQLFEAQVQRSPDAIAVISHSTQLTYRELNHRSHQLACYLQEQGIQPDDLVGLCVERSIDMLVGMLGILKAGGTYVPIDPSYPPERITNIVSDAQVSVVLTQAKWLSILPNVAVTALCLDRDWEQIALAEADLVCQSQAEHLAYVIYTSGSTGKPKGVMIEHRSLVNFTQAAITDYQLTASDRVLQFASISFDTAAEEIYPCLCVGGTVVLRTDEMLGSVATFLQQCQALNVTVLDLPTAYWHQLTIQLAASRLSLPPTLRLVIIGGEAALPAQLTLWKTWVGEVPKLVNTYGPTEATIVTTTHLLAQLECTHPGTSVPIGKPIANTAAYVLDRDLQPVPIGVPGELHIGGMGLARGYLHRPELTAEKFILWRDATRLYKTGDLVRYQPDGNLEYLGRIDQQVKIRGFRIELGEVEAALGQHPDVQEVAVIAREDTPGDKRLVAYVVSNLIPDRLPMQVPCVLEIGDQQTEVQTEDISVGGVGLIGVSEAWQRGQPIRLGLPLPIATEIIWLKGQVAWQQDQRVGIQLELTSAQQSMMQHSVNHILEAQGFLKTLQRTLTGNLREYLRTKLPEYMLPSTFVLLTTLPLTVNGKIDRKALPIPDQTRFGADTDFVAPRTPIEEVIVGVWSEVLSLRSISIHDNFFELGGHSLLGVQIISRLRTIFHVDLPLRCLFESPTIAGLAQQLEAARSQTTQAFTPPLLPVDRQPFLPLSFSQEMMWVLAQLQPQVPYYNHTFTLRWSGSLNVMALEQALATIIRRHEIWRTTYTIVNDAPVQVIHANPSFGLRFVDLRHLPLSERAPEAIRQVTAEVQQPFDLTSDLLIRATLVQSDQTDYQLFLTLHHIGYDGISLHIFLRELDLLYTAICAGQPSPLPELPLQYADYACWQRQCLQAEILEPRLAYWQQQLAELPSLQLPFDRPRPAAPTLAGASYDLKFAKALTEQLKQLSRQAGVTLFITLQAAFQTLLARYTGQTDIPVGFITAGRDRPELEGLLGFFANFLVLRTDLSGNPNFRELLVRVREVALAAYTHELPFQKLVEVLRSERQLGQNPLYQVMLLLDPALPETDSGWTVQYPSPIENGTVTCDLLITLSEGSEGITGQISYSTELFNPETIVRMAGHLQMLLEGIVADPEQTLAELPLLTLNEQKQLQQWQQTQVDYDLNRCLHEWIEAQVEQTPDAIAVRFEQQVLTYRELNQQANQLAHYLNQQGVRPEVLVGICVERSLAMIIGLLGILKAGGAYVPFDPGYPQERLAFMLEDTQVPILLTQSHLIDRLPPHQAQTICLDRHWEHIAQSPTHNPTSGVTATNLAYVIYTSGSTGKPKGAMNAHYSICNRLLWMQDTYQLTASDRVLQKTPFSFDVSVWELFWPLMTGAQLVMARPEGHKDASYLVQLIAEQHITTLHFVPSMLRVFLEEPNLNQCHRIRQVMCSGEALSVELQERFFTRLSAELHNLYGPTEAAVDVTFWNCQPNTGLSTVPIGHPISNTQIYLLDSQLQPVPVGVPGELYIGGVNVARGYLNRPELTAERFIANPLPILPGMTTRPAWSDRLYKTGDLARYRPDGAIEYLGRIDHQVKIRGFRIELGEIEAVLGQYPTVRTVVVLDREMASGDRQLVAYVVPVAEKVIVPYDLQAFLQRKLPEYMVPSAFVTLDQLPVTANGKLDRKALPVPEALQSHLGSQFVAPRTTTERALAVIWQEVLELEQVGIHDHFLELGGHSLLVTQVISRSRQAFQVELAFRHLFEAPTIAELAVVIEELQSTASSRTSSITALSRDARRIKRSVLTKPTPES
ncbi:amino acid adenylation domain-containing protein [Pantanalinema sp. GBBB05]|uniref:amino acid adenylation domain-containing protein n=1 Tax=Pantanalinema sp. GBBB05 TaxID=2604139 RepID=UPI001D55EAAA|nr:amino acid adenylation domain-containing protein [Pantanalinema sp. GBBB05]